MTIRMTFLRFRWYGLAVAVIGLVWLSMFFLPELRWWWLTLSGEEVIEIHGERLDLGKDFRVLNEGESLRGQVNTFNLIWNMSDNFWPDVYTGSIIGVIVPREGVTPHILEIWPHSYCDSYDCESVNPTRLVRGGSSAFSAIVKKSRVIFFYFIDSCSAIVSVSSPEDGVDEMSRFAERATEDLHSVCGGN